MLTSSTWTHLSSISKQAFRRFATTSSSQARARRRNAVRCLSRSNACKPSNRSQLITSRCQCSLVQSRTLLRSLAGPFLKWGPSDSRRKKIHNREYPDWKSLEPQRLPRASLALKSWRSQMKKRKLNRHGVPLPRLSWSPQSRTRSSPKTPHSYLYFRCLRQATVARPEGSGSRVR